MLPVDNRALLKWKTKLNCHPRPLFKAHITAMRLDDLAHKRQPQSLTSIRSMRSAFPDFFSKWAWDACASRARSHQIDDAAEELRQIHGLLFTLRNEGPFAPGQEFLHETLKPLRFGLDNCQAFALLGRRAVFQIFGHAAQGRQRRSQLVRD